MVVILAVLLMNFTLLNSLMVGLIKSILLENAMTSTERVQQYGQLKAEANSESDVQVLPRQKQFWPRSGEIEFNKVSLAYRKGGETDELMETVLRNVSFQVNDKEKIGIIGRTGAGKSSLVAALFRTAELLNGNICIDNTDIAELGLHDLRKNLSVILQEPQIFAGSLRFNIDPGNRYSDKEVFHALTKANLKEFVLSSEKGLHSQVEEKGSNLSDGERQLVCLARALVKDSKILVMDEATANIDPETNRTVQRVIQNCLPDVTVLVIAHKLENVLDLDKILVLSNGEIQEFDSPANLLQNPHSALSQLMFCKEEDS